VRQATATQPRPPLVGWKVYRRLPWLWLSSRRAGARQHQLFDQVERYCMFVGYPRSGHSLIGSLLDAHPDMVIAHELDVLRLLSLNFDRDQLYALILANEQSFTAAGRHWLGSDYTVPGGWQGDFRRLLVIGDKKGGRSTGRLRNRPDLLDRLRQTVGVPLRVVHVIRNPFDNIASMKLRLRRELPLANVADKYFWLCDAMDRLGPRFAAGELTDLRYEDLVADPAASLRSLARFLEVPEDDGWLAASASVVGERPSLSRSRFDWPPELVREIQRRSRHYRFLARYSFEE
jgi:Sulfotransferase family